MNDTGSAAASHPAPPPSLPEKPSGCFSGSSCLVQVWLAIYLFLGLQFLLLLIPGLIALAALIGVGIAGGMKWLSARRCNLLRNLIFVSTVAVPAVYLPYKGYLAKYYVVPTDEYSPYAERWARRAAERLGKMAEEGERPDAGELKELRRQAGMHLREAPPVALGEQPSYTIVSGHPRIDGATSLAVIYRSFVRAAYVDDESAVERGGRWDDIVRCSRTPFAYDNLIDGEADMIFVFRPSPDQVAAAAARGREFTITPIGREAFVFFVNDRNPVKGLTTAQLRDIYGGRITRWREVGGGGGRIIPFQRSEGSGSQSRMLRFMDGDRLMNPALEHRFGTMSDIVVHTARYHNYRGAIGYSFLYFMKNMVDAHGVRLLDVDGSAPSLASIRDGSYPLTDEICVVTAGTDNPHVAEFIRWMLSPQGQKLVEKAGYIPLDRR